LETCLGFACLLAGREFVIWDLERNSVDWLSLIFSAKRVQLLYQPSPGEFCPLVREAVGGYLFSSGSGTSEGGP
jgi:hypothetical protein